MPYLTEAQYAQRYTQAELDQLKATGGGVGLSFDSAEADARELVDSYLAAIPGRTFAVPLEAPPARIVGVTADLTRYELWARRASQEVKDRRDQALEYLKDLVAGRAVLSIAPAPAEPTPSPAQRVGFSTNGRVFTDRTLCGFIGEGCPDD